MAACAMLTYGNVTPDAWTCIQQAASKYIPISGPSGSASKDGFTVEWHYSAAQKQLSIQCVQHPWLVECSVANARINDAVEACLREHRIEMASMMPSKA